MRYHEIVSDQSLLEGVEPRLIPAVKHNGKVYRGEPGQDHFAALDRIPQTERSRATSDGDNRGYVNHSGHFLNRRSAQNYAVKHDLISPKAPSWAKTAPELASENLAGHER